MIVLMLVQMLKNLQIQHPLHVTPLTGVSLSLVPGSLPVCLGFSIPDTDLVNVGDVQAGMTSVMSLAYVPQQAWVEWGA